MRLVSIPAATDLEAERLVQDLRKVFHSLSISPAQRVGKNWQWDHYYVVNCAGYKPSWDFASVQAQYPDAEEDNSGIERIPS